MRIAAILAATLGVALVGGGRVVAVAAALLTVAVWFPPLLVSVLVIWLARKVKG